MTLPTSGPISMLQIATEFGGTVPHSLNEYYGKASGIPTSGQISMNQFYGKSAAVVIPIISAWEFEMNGGGWSSLYDDDLTNGYGLVASQYGSAEVGFQSPFTTLVIAYVSDGFKIYSQNDTYVTPRLSGTGEYTWSVAQPVGYIRFSAEIFRNTRITKLKAYA